MNQFRKLLGGAWSILVVCTLAFTMGGCEGDDGAQGPAGPQGPAGDTGAPGATGPAGADATVIPLESCGVCHDAGQFASAAVAHELDPIEAVSDIVFGTANAGADLTVAFHVDFDVDGTLVPATGYDEVQRAYFNDGTFRTDLRARDPDTLDTIDLTADQVLLANLGEGNYLLTVFGYGAEFANDNRWLFRVQDSTERQTRVYFYADTGAGVTDPVAVTAEDCAACHGPEGIPVHGSAFIASDGGEVCLACHGVQRETVEEIDGVDQLVIVDTPRLGIVTHGYHSGLDDPITYPTYMANCSVCHDKESGFLAAVNQMPVYYDGCISCHGSMDSWPFEGTPLDFHLLYTSSTNCQNCHSEGEGPRVLVTEFHNGWETPRHGFIVDGEDVSITEGALFDWRITGVEVVDEGANLAITWVADYGEAGVNPCNDTVAAGAPVFFLGPNLEEMTMYRNYAQGDDFMLGPGSTPGAPSSVDLDATNTVCEGNVATTTLPVDDDVVAVKARVALGGKPLVLAPEGLTTPAIIEARVPTPTYDFLVADGAAAPARRAVVDTNKCLGCHVGSLYQHGGDRVDNVDMCLMCHNVASNDQNRRESMGIFDGSNAYDGQVGETFGMKTMLHRVHSANYEFPNDRYNDPYLVYRSRGVYAFAEEGDFPPDWNTGEACVDAYGRDGTIVAGADPTLAASCQVHFFEAPTFPRSVYECAACHAATFDKLIPDQTIAMATTVDAGAAPWNNYLDDVLQGPATSACVSCHAWYGAKGHAYQNGWVPQAFPMGRQTIIDAGN